LAAQIPDLPAKGQNPAPTPLFQLSRRGHNLYYPPPASFEAQTPEQGKPLRQKIKTSGRALPEVSEVYQKAAKEFIGYPEATIDYRIT
jgi:hypothetical protein